MHSLGKEDRNHNMVKKKYIYIYIVFCKKCLGPLLCFLTTPFGYLLKHMLVWYVLLA